MASLHHQMAPRAPRRSSGASVRRLVILLVITLSLASCIQQEIAPIKPLDRGTISVSVAETIDGQPTEMNISQFLLEKAFLLHGFRLAPAAEARYRFEGTLACTFFQELTFDFQGASQLLEHQFHALFEGRLIDTGDPSMEGSGERVEEFTFPEPMMNGRTDLDLARRDIRRRAATLLVQRSLGGEILGNPSVKGLIDALGDAVDPRIFNEIVADLVAEESTAVPYLLDTLRDERVVQMKGVYPGIEEYGEDQLQYFHIADLALVEILDRSSGLDLLSTEEYRLKIQTGWAWIWEDLQEIPAKYRTRLADRKSSIPAAVRQ